MGITVARGEESASGRQVRATTPGTCTHWNLNTDYLNSPNQKNPNPDSCGNQDVWHFMQGITSNHNPQTYSLMTQVTTSASRTPFYDPTFFHWAGKEYPSQGGFPFFGRSSHQYSTCSATRYIPANTIVGHPAHIHPLIIGWRSPVTGTVSVTGGATSLDGGTIVWYVDKDATNLAYGWTANGSSQYFQSGTNGGNLAYVKVQQGDFLYLGIDPHDDYYCDTTALDISIDLVPNVTLTVTKTGTGQITSSDALLNCGTTCQADYTQNSTVTLTATPTTGNTFTQWSGACTGTTATTTVTLDQAKTCTATFAKVIPKYTLTISKTGTGTGSITGTGMTCGTDCTEDYTAKTQVTLTATPETGSKFISWGGSCSGTATTATVTMNQAKNCTANFVPANATSYSRSSFK